MFDFFFTRHWVFISSNSVKLWSKLSDRDRLTFNYDVKNIDWPTYFENYVLGTRQYILNENIDTVPEGKKKVLRYK